MRIGVRLGPVWVSTSTHSRRRRRSTSRPRQPNWHAKGKATTPDGREVDFRCQHSHRSQDAALKCSATVRKQIESGQGLHLITRVRSTPASREATRQRAAQNEARQHAKAAQRAQAAQQRAQRQEARRQAKAASRAQSARYPAQQDPQPAVSWQPPAATPPQFTLRTQKPPQRRREEASYRPAGQRQSFQQPNDHVNRQYAAPSQPRSLSWPATGLITAGAATILGMVLAVAAGSNPRGALATTAGGIITLGLICVVIFATAALLQRRRRHKNQDLPPAPATSDPRNVYPAPTFTGPAFQAPITYPSRAVVGQQSRNVHPRPNGHGDSTQWNS